MDLNVVRVAAGAWGPLSTAVAAMLPHASLLLVPSLPIAPLSPASSPNISPRGCPSPLPPIFAWGYSLHLRVWPGSAPTPLHVNTSHGRRCPTLRTAFRGSCRCARQPLPFHLLSRRRTSCHVLSLLLSNIPSTLTFPEEQTWAHFLQCCSLSAYSIIWMC